MKSRKPLSAALAVALFSGVMAFTANTAMSDESMSGVSTSVEAAGDCHTSEARQALEHAGFTPDELNQLSSEDIETTYRALIEGSSVEERPETRAGVSALAKAILKIWHKLPAGVRNAIGAYTGLDGFLNAIDHFTGTTEHVIYSACKYVGMNDQWANIVTKTITLFI